MWEGQQGLLSVFPNGSLSSLHMVVPPRHPNLDFPSSPGLVLAIATSLSFEVKWGIRSDSAVVSRVSPINSHLVLAGRPDWHIMYSLQLAVDRCW